MDVSLNSTACVATQTNWGEFVIHNICNGQTHVVPWGTLEYAAFIGIGGFLAAGALMFAAMGFDVLRDILRGY